MYSAAQASLSGGSALIFDGDRLTSHMNAMFSWWLTKPLTFHPWVYPPSFLLILTPFARLGFLASYAAFQMVSAGLLAAALLYRADNARWARWIAVAVFISPAASINAVDGQCAFLVGALLVGAVRLSPVRPLGAGVLLGLLTFKPQFGLLIPVALIASRQWRSLASATVTTLALAAASVAQFGVQPWIEWGRQTADAYAGGDPKWAAYGRLWGDSVYACAVLLGVPIKMASMIQTASILASAGSIWVTFRSSLTPDLKLGVLLAATLLAAPHWAPYDAVLLVIAAGLWLADGTRPLALWPWIMGLTLWFVAALGPPVLAPIARFVPVLLAGFIMLILSRASDAGRPA